MASEVSIKQAAIARLGSEVPASLSEDVDEVIAANSIYETVRDSALTKHAWSFAQKYEAVQATSDEPPPQWETVFALPADCVNVLDVLNSEGQPVAYEVCGQDIYANGTDDLTVHFIWGASEARWPADFAEAIEEELFGRLLECFEERNAGERRRMAARVMMKDAQRRDRRQNPPGRRGNGTLLRAWFNKDTARQ